MDCHHHHTGNRTLIFHLPLRLVSRCFLAAPRSQSVREWPVCPAKFLSNRGTHGRVPTLSVFVSCLTGRWRSATTNVYAQSLIFCMLCGVTFRGGNGWIAGHIYRHIGWAYKDIILRLAGGFSRPLSISTDTAVIDTLLPCGTLRIFG